jgi:hypothetical protein
MFERYFHRAMKYGARLLFSIAVLLVIREFVDGMQRVMHFAGPPGDRDRSTWLYHLRSFWIGLSVGWPYLINEILRGLSSASFPFFGALVVHRIDRWMSGRAP